MVRHRFRGLLPFCLCLIASRQKGRRVEIGSPSWFCTVAHHAAQPPRASRPPLDFIALLPCESTLNGSCVGAGISERAAVATKGAARRPVSPKEWSADAKGAQCPCSPPTLRNPSIPQSVNPPIRQSVNPSIPQSVNPPIRQSVNLSIRQSVNPPIRQSPTPPLPQSVNPSLPRGLRMV